MAILTTQEQRWVDTKLVDLQTQQVSYASLYQKYQQQAKTTYGEITVEVHELVAPDNSVGYIVLLYKTVNNIPYVCSYGFGRDSLIHTRDWVQYVTNGR